MRTNLELLQRQNKECEVCLIMRTPESECVHMTFESLDEMEDVVSYIFVGATGFIMCVVVFYNFLMAM